MSTSPELFLIWNKLLFPKITALIFISLSLSACNSDNKQGKFELELLSTAFGEINVTQGETTIATIAINRNVTSSKYTSAIDLSLLDPPDWLKYTMENNPSDDNINLIRLMIAKETAPGIYRLIIHGAGNLAGQLIEDSVTFHLVVKTAQTNSNNKISAIDLQRNC